ncbi:MAG: carboxypeptidase-like regulatory domain-containing protein, partial [Bacteroidota bacterium]
MTSHSFISNLKPLFLACLYSLLIYSQAYSENITEGYFVSGNIQDFSSRASIVSATILLKGSRIGTVSDREGNFELTIPKGSKSIIIIGHKSYDLYEIPIVTSGSTNIFLEKHGLGYASFTSPNDSIKDYTLFPYQQGTKPLIIVDD